MAVDLQEKEPIPSVKDLASSDPSLRRKNLQQIISHLELRPASHHLSHTQALKLWRGFHVALYMHDSKNQLSVQTLIATLASTFDIVRAKDVELASESTATATATATTTDAGNEDDGNEFTGFDDDNDNVKLTGTTASEDASSWLSNFTTAFWETIAREWSGIDQWRINKYLLLTRFVLRKIFEISLSAHFGTTHSPSPSSKSVEDNNQTSRKRKPDKSSEPSDKNKKAKTTSTTAISTTNASSKSTTTTTTTESRDPTVLPSQLTILSEHPLSPRSRTVSDGLRLHVLDIYLDELFASPLSSSLSLPSSDDDDDDDVMRPVRGVAKEALARHVRVRAKEVIAEFEERLRTLSRGDDDEEEDE